MLKQQSLSSNAGFSEALKFADSYVDLMVVSESSVARQKLCKPWEAANGLDRVQREPGHIRG